MTSSPLVRPAPVLAERPGEAHGWKFTRRAEHHAGTLTAGCIAGMLFAALFGTCAILNRTGVGSSSDRSGAWLAEGRGQVEVALALLPFAGIFFLWFIAVSRQRLGRYEDRFISTLVLGSGLLFLGMVFVAAALGAAILANYSDSPAFAGSQTYVYVQYAYSQLFGVYALRMAAVFLICQATAWLRHGLMPKWLALPTYVVALVLLFIVGMQAWAILIFPVWVFLVSAYLLVVSARGGVGEAAGPEVLSAGA
jgi:hypothetical protein